MWELIRMVFHTIAHTISIHSSWTLYTNTEIYYQPILGRLRSPRLRKSRIVFNLYFLNLFIKYLGYHWGYHWIIIWNNKDIIKILQQVYTDFCQFLHTRTKPCIYMKVPLTCMSNISPHLLLYLKRIKWSSKII